MKKQEDIQTFAETELLSSSDSLSLGEYNKDELNLFVREFKDD